MKKIWWVLGICAASITLSAWFWHEDQVEKAVYQTAIAGNLEQVHLCATLIEQIDQGNMTRVRRLLLLNLQNSLQALDEETAACTPQNPIIPNLAGGLAKVKGVAKTYPYYDMACFRWEPLVAVARAERVANRLEGTR